MDFIKNCTTFPSRVHRIIYITALRQTPLSLSLADTGGMEPSLIESCNAYYAYIQSMLSDMYENADSWHLGAGVLDKFLNGKKENAMKQKQPARTLVLRSETYNSVPHYFRFLFTLGQLGNVENQCLMVPAEAYKKIRTVYDREFAQKPTGTQKNIAYSDRLKAFQRAGLYVTEQTDGSAKVTCVPYPTMFQAMCVLAKSAAHVKTFGEHNFMFCDFRQIERSYNPCYEDVVSPLSDDQRAVADAIHQMALAMKLRVSCTTYWKVNYHYKGKHVMCLDTDDFNGEKTGLCHNVRFRINGSHDDRYLEMITGEGDAFKQYLMKHLNYCTACSTSHLGWFKEMWGRKVRLCCEPHFRIINPKNTDLKYIRKFIELRMDMIRLEKDEAQ